MGEVKNIINDIQKFPTWTRTGSKQNNSL